jgi:hydrogenase maturation factor
MAGSYNHVVTDSGNLRSPEMVNRMLENGGDVFEAVEEMVASAYGARRRSDVCREAG